MTAPDRTTWTVAEDADGDETLWYGDIAVLRECDLATGGGGSAVIARAYRRELFAVLTRVLAPDEATIERLAQAVGRGAVGRAAMREIIPKVLAALAGTSAQARHTADDAKGGCPSHAEMTGGGEHG